MTKEPTDAENLFWSIADGAAVLPPFEHSTMMGSECARVGGEFVAMVHVHEQRLIVKLPADRVSELVAQGVGESFAPNGKVFKEWLLVVGDDESRWSELLVEGHAFAKR